MDGSADRDRKYLLLESVLNALVDVNTHNEVARILELADTLEPRLAPNAVCMIAGSLVGIVDTHPRIRGEEKHKILRLVRLACQDHTVIQGVVAPVSDRERPCILEPARVIYTHAAQTLAHLLSLSPSSDARDLKAYHDARAMMRRIFESPTDPHFHDGMAIADFIPGQFGHGWPFSVSDIQVLLEQILAHNGKIETTPATPRLGEVVHLPRAIFGTPPMRLPSVYVRVPGDDMAPGDLRGVELVQYHQRFLANPLDMWARDPKYLTTSKYALFAQALPTGEQARHRASPLKVAHDTGAAAIVATAFNSLVTEALPTIAGPLGRLGVAYAARLIGKMSWDFLSDGDGDGDGDDDDDLVDGADDDDHDAP
ncbi:hypothetical protein [Enhygromyxa salina]|uniref:hypothetical protein n=1 Tax=Enhygromyxa salina TaxID=215803 RepID=UPI0011B24382|nr:hypothetical protein [Enhygromyxa salina]